MVVEDTGQVAGAFRQTATRHIPDYPLLLTDVVATAILKLPRGQVLQVPGLDGRRDTRMMKSWV